MASIDQIRSIIPGGDKLSDEDLIQRTADVMGMNPVEVAEYVGYKPSSAGLARTLTGAGIDRYQAGLYGLGEAVTGALGFTGAEETLAARRRANELEADVSMARAREMGAVESFRDVEDVGSAGRYLLGLGAQSLPYMGEALAGGVVTRGVMSGTRAALGSAVKSGDTAAAAAARKSLQTRSLLGGASATYPSGVGMVLQEQREQVDETDLGSAAAIGVPYAALNVLGVEGALARGALSRNVIRGLDEIEGVKGGLARAGATGVRTGITEMAAEVGQTGLEQIGRMVVDPSEQFLSPESRERFAEAAVGGFALGKTFGVVGGGWRRSEGSLLPGSNDNLRDTGTPSGDAIGEAIKSGEQFTQVETDQNKIPREVAPGIFYTPATGVYTTSEGQDITESIGRARRAAGAQPAERLEMVGAGAPQFDANQMTLPGMPPVMQPQAQPMPVRQAPLGPQPGQQELFDVTGAPTYGAAGPSLADLALQRIMLEGIQPTRTRMPLAERAEALYSDGFIDENEHDTVYAMLRDSKYGQVERFLKGVEDAKRRQEEQAAAGVGAVSEQAGADRDGTGAGRTDVGQVQPFGAGSFLGRPSGEQDVAAGISGARPSTVGPAAGSVSGDGSPVASETEVQGQEVTDEEVDTAKAEWDEEFRTNVATEPRFSDLSPERKQTWAVAIRDGRATGALFDQLVAVHNKEKASAVQKRETTEVPVRKRARSSEAVGEKDTQKRQAAPEGRKAKEKVVTWTGKFTKQGEATGEGTYTWEDGDKFVGEMRAGKVWNGVFTTADGKTQKVEKGYAVKEGAVERRGPEGAAVGGNTKAQVDSWFAPILKSWPFGPKVNTVQSVSDLPTEMKPSPTAKGGFYKGEIWIVADNATSKLDAMVTLFHEAVGHFGFRSLVRAYSTEYINIMDGIARTNVRVREEAKKWRERNADRQRIMRLTDTQFRALSIEEAIADMAYQTLRNPALNILNRSPALNKFVNWIAGKLKALGFTDLAKAITQFTADVDVYRLLSMSRNVLTSGTQNSVSNPEDNPLFSSFNQSARWSDKRINDLLGTWAYRNDENDTKAYAAFVDPQAFLEATSPQEYRLEVLEKENKTLDTAALAGESQPIFLLVELDSLGKKEAIKIVGHEGRHRMMALRDAGVREVPVVVINGFAGQRMANAKTIDYAFLSPKPSEGEKGFSVFNMMPISFANRAELKKVFGTGVGANVEEADVVFRDPGFVAPQERRETANAVKDFFVRLWPTKNSKGRKVILGLRFLTDIRDNLGPQLTGVKEYVNLALDMGAATNELLKEGSEIATRWANLGDEGKVLDAVAGAATSAEIHPDIPLDQTEHKSGPTRKVTNRHLFNEDGTLVDPETANNHKKISDKFKQLSPQAKKVYYDARDFMHRNWLKRQELINKTIMDTWAPEIAEAQRLGNQELVKELTKKRNEMIAEFGRQLAQLKGPYFPLKRFGEFFVVRKSDEYKAVEAELLETNSLLSDLYKKYEITPTLRKTTEEATRAFVKYGEDPIVRVPEAAKKEISEARKQVRALQKKLDKMVKEGDKHFVSESFESERSADERAKELGVKTRIAEEYFRELSPMNKGFIDKLAQVVGGALSADQANQARAAMYEIYLAALPQTSALKSELKRRGVDGWDKDMQRAFADHAQKDAHYLSRLEFADKMTSELLRMQRAKKEIEKAPGDSDSAKKAGELYNEMARRHAASLKYHASPIEDGLSTLAFIYQLGISPAFLLTSMSQPWMISLPFMAGRHNASAVIRELGKGFADAGAAAVTAIKEQGYNFTIDLKKFPEGEQKMLEDAMKAGLLDISLAVDIGAYAQGGRTGINKVTHAMGILPHQVEVLNRTMTALAAYRLEIQKGSDQEKATEYAKQTLDKTHINYSSTNAPYWLKPGVVPFGKVLFQYRKFQLGMLTLMGNQIKQAYKGDPESRKQARRMLFGIFGMHAIMTGAVGLPAVGSIMFIANVLNAIFGDEDEPFEAEAEFRKFIADAFGVEAGLVVAKGLPTLLGVDLSRNIGLGDIAAPIRVLRSDKEGRDLYLEILAAGLGPTIGGLGPQFAEGIQMLMKGDIYRGVEGLTPRFFRDWTRAVRLSEEGLTTKAGQVIFQPEEISAWDKAIQAVGFPSTRISERGAAAGAVQAARKTLQDRRSELTRDYVAARRANDQRAMAAVQREIQEFNRKRLAKGESTLKPRDLLNAYKQRERYTKQLNPQGVSLARSERALGEYGAFAVVR